MGGARTRRTRRVRLLELEAPVPPAQTMPDPRLWRGLAYALGAELVVVLVVLAACKFA